MPVMSDESNARAKMSEIYLACGLAWGYRAQILTMLSRPPETRYLSMYRSRSAGCVCPLVRRRECCMLVRL